MAKNQSQKKRASAETVRVQAKPAEAKISEIKSTSSSVSVWLYPCILFMFTVLIYSNTFHHRFVLDDHGIIRNNKITKAPISWENTKIIFSTPLRKGDFSDLENSLYRPFTKLLFNIEWNVFGGDPHKFHVVNVLLYALTGVFIFFIFYDAFKKKWIIPFLTALLFLAHPIHTEAVSNIKSADEILSLLGIVMAIRGIQLYISKDNLLFLILAIVGFLIGSFSKESTVVAIALIPLFIYFFTNASIVKNVITSSAMTCCSLFFLLCRYKSLHGYPEPSPLSALDNYMVLCKDPSYAGTHQFSSAINTLGLYLKTFLFPTKLSCDYSFSTLTPVGFADLGFILSFIILISMFAFAVYKLVQKNPIGFGFLWFFITMSITSNVFFLIGTSFGERLFFAPSLGLCLAVVVALAHYFQKGEEGNFLASFKKSPLLFGSIFIVVILFSYKTYSRNEDWKSDFNLFSKDVENFPNSTHLLFYVGNHLSSTEYAEDKSPEEKTKAANDAIMYLNKALSIYPALPSDGYNQLGKAYFNIGQLDSAQKYYLKAFHEDSTNAIFINNLGTVYYNSSTALTNLGTKYRDLGRLDSANYYIQAGTNRLLEALPYFKKAHERDTTESDFVNNIGCIYGATQRPDSAIYWFKKAYALDSLDITSLQFLDITYRAINQVPLADFYRNKLVQVKAIRAEQKQ